MQPAPLITDHRIIAHADTNLTRAAWSGHMAEAHQHCRVAIALANIAREAGYIDAVADGIAEQLFETIGADESNELRGIYDAAVDTIYGKTRAEREAEHAARLDAIRSKRKAPRNLIAAE